MTFSNLILQLLSRIRINPEKV
ncbi:hypothetical protein AGR1B_pa0222 [Agrobacterium fabacearum S56]|nr:hypothetical protein AGR1B_pa0222 [Agrobacterium fabacearum S56]